MFSSSGEQGSMDFLTSLEARIPERLNDELSRPFIAEEIHHAITQMHPSKAPGPNKLPPVFFQHN